MFKPYLSRTVSGSRCQQQSLQDLWLKWQADGYEGCRGHPANLQDGRVPYELKNYSTLGPLGLGASGDKCI